MKRKNSRAKGQRGERELASELQRLFGVNARRGQQYCGGADSPDVVSDFNDIHFALSFFTANAPSGYRSIRPCNKRQATQE